MCVVQSRITGDAVPVARVGRRRDQYKFKKDKEVFTLQEVEMRAYYAYAIKYDVGLLFCS